MHNHNLQQRGKNSKINSTGESKKQKQKMEIDNGENVTVKTKFYSITSIRWERKRIFIIISITREAHTR